MRAALFERLSEPERASVRTAVIADMANKRNATIALGFAVAVAAVLAMVFAKLGGGFNETGTQVMLVFFGVPLLGVVLFMIDRARKSEVLFALAGTGLSVDEKRALVAWLQSDPAVREAVARDVKQFTSAAVQGVGRVARKGVGEAVK